MEPSQHPYPHTPTFLGIPLQCKTREVIHLTPRKHSIFAPPPPVSAGKAAAVKSRPNPAAVLEMPEAPEGQALSLSLSLVQERGNWRERRSLGSHRFVNHLTPPEERLF